MLRVECQRLVQTFNPGSLRSRCSQDFVGFAFGYSKRCARDVDVVINEDGNCSYWRGFGSSVKRQRQDQGNQSKGNLDNAGAKSTGVGVFGSSSYQKLIAGWGSTLPPPRMRGEGDSGGAWQLPQYMESREKVERKSSDKRLLMRGLERETYRRETYLSSVLDCRHLDLR